MELNIAGCRSILGESAKGLSDAQIEELRDFLVVLSGVIVDAYSDLENIAGNLDYGDPTIDAALEVTL